MLNTSPLNLLEKIIADSVTLHGDDWDAVARHIKLALNALPEPDRRNIDQNLSVILSDQPVVPCLGQSLH